MISSLIGEQLVGDAQRLIEGAKKIVILTHMAPDGDAMGSSLGLRWWLEEMGKAVTVVVPSAFPDFLGWMPGAEDILVYDISGESAVCGQIREAIEAADLAICADFNEPKRIGAVGTMLLEVKNERDPKNQQIFRGSPGERKKEEGDLPILMIDHHPNPSDVADVVLSYPESPSASEIVYRLIYEMKGQLSLNAATCLYTGMMTDTGNFAFNSNHPEMYEIVGEMVRLGVDKDAIYNRVFNAYSESRMRLMGFCLYQKMRIFPKEHVAFIYLSKRELARFHFQSGDAEGLVNLPLQIRDIHYSCFMREDKVYPSEEEKAGGSKIKVKISMRSQGDRPVNTFCQEVFGGGGHKNASGGEYYGPLPEAVKLFLENYQRYCK